MQESYRIVQNWVHIHFPVRAGLRTKKFYLFCRRVVYRYANRSTSQPGSIALGLDIRVQSLLYDEAKQKNF